MLRTLLARANPIFIPGGEGGNPHEYSGEGNVTPYPDVHLSNSKQLLRRLLGRPWMCGKVGLTGLCLRNVRVYLRRCW